MACLACGFAGSTANGEGRHDLPSTNAGFVLAGAISLLRRLSGEPHPHRRPCYQRRCAHVIEVISTRATLLRLKPSINSSNASRSSAA